MLLLGLGQGELRNLRGEHFDLEQKSITVRRQKTQKVFAIPIYLQAREFVEKLRDAGQLESGNGVW
jgi:integrase